jgi:hypothetical protein
MTTVACNRESMAADSFCSDGNRVAKVVRLPRALLGYCGDLYFANRILDWFRAGERGPFPEAPSDELAIETNLLRLSRSGIHLVSGRGVVVEVTGAYAAIGSGADVALGAMFQGATPSQALAAAIYHDANTKAPVDHEYLIKGRTK